MSEGYQGTGRLFSRRTPRRRLLRAGLSLAVGAAALPLLNCGGDSEESSSTSSQATGGTAATTAAGAAATTVAPQVRRGGTLKFGFNRDIQGLDPGVVTDSYVGFIFVGGLYDALLHYRPDYQVAPGLAEKWETPDPTTIVMSLRSGVTFHDGEPFTAESAKANLDRILAATSTAKDKASLVAVESVSAPSPTTLQIKLKSPDAVVVPLLGDYAGMMASPKAFAELMTKPVGTGPMKFQSWDKGAKVTLAKNPNYWAEGSGGKLPYLDGFEYIVIPDLEQQLNSLKTGQVHLLTIITGDTIDRVKGESSLQYVGGPSRLVRTQFLNMAWPGLERVEVRQAVAQAIDRKAIVDAVYAGHAEVAATMGTPGDWVFDRAIQPYKFDVDAAKRLLAQAGFGNGLKLTVKVTGAPGEFQTISDLVRPQLKRAGIDYEYETVDPTASFQVIYREGKTAANIAGNDGRADFGQVVDLCFSKTGTFNLAPAFDKSWQSDSQIDNLITRGRQTLDQQQRKGIYADLQRQVHDKVYSQNVLVFPEQGWAAAKRVRNLNWYQDARFRLHEVWLES